MLKIDQYLHTLIKVAMEAGRSILDIYASDFGVSYKDDHSPLTLADRSSNEIITSRLSAPPFNQYPILSEEGRDIPYKERKEWEYQRSFSLDEGFLEHDRIFLECRGLDTIAEVSLKPFA